MTDLTGGLLPGLLDTHVKALRRRRIRTLEALARSDRKVVHGALADVRPRPRYVDVDAWIAAAAQSQAASVRAGTDQKPDDEVVVDPHEAVDEGWEALASFVLSFEQQGDGARRLVAEQAERPAPQPRHEWADWPVQEAAAWVADTVENDLLPQRQGSAEPSPDAARLALDEVVLVGATGETDLLAPGTGEVTVRDGDRLRLRVVPPVPGDVALRAHRRGLPPRRLGPVRAGADGRAELDLSDLPPGVHDCRLIVHATDDGRREQGVPALAPAVVRLPLLALSR